MGFNDLSEREKELVRAIGKCQTKLEMTEECLRKVMAEIGAVHGEEAFVKSYIAKQITANQLCNDVDRFVANTNRTLDDFEKEMKRWDELDKKTR